MPLSLGKTIKRLRKERNLTQEELAELLSVTYQAVSKWENETGMPDISQIVPLASVFGVSTDVLFGISGIDDNFETAKLIHENSKDKKIDKLKWDILQEGLRCYPNNRLLLMASIEYGLALAYPENDCYDKAHGDEIYRECIRQANIIIKHFENTNEILRAHMIMVLLHSAYGDSGRAREHAEKFPVRSDMTYHGMMAFIAQHEKKHDNEAEHCRADANFHLEALAYSMMHLANAYKHMQHNEYALDVYNRAKQLLDLFPNDEHFSTPTVWVEWGQIDDLIAKVQQ